MKIKLLRNCLIAGQHCQSGEVVDVSEQDGRYLTGRGQATLESKAKAKKSTVKRVSLIVGRTCLVGGKHVARGDIINAVEPDAKYLTGHGYAFDPKSDAGEALAKTVKAEAKSLQAAADAAAEEEKEALKKVAEEAAKAANAAEASGD